MKDIVEEYQAETRDKYKSRGYAERYFRTYTSLRPTHLYAIVAAWREQRAIEKLLARIPGPIGEVLDLPAGTGKLIPVHARQGYSVIGADVSHAMLTAGRAQWERVPKLAGLVVTDVLGTAFPDDAFDVAICLRLLHRLPDELAERALVELARIARRYLVVSTGIDTFTLTGLVRPKRMRPQAVVEAQIAKIGTVVERLHVIRGISKELVYLIDVSGR